MNIFNLLATLWFFRETKVILFWLYLWQLKEYHIGRFLDHFQTDKGKKLLINPLFFLKILLLFAFLFLSSNYLIFILVFIYSFEILIFLKNLFTKNARTPVLTGKSVVLILVALIFAIFYLSLSSFFPTRFIFYLLIFDILTPFITSFIVLVLQPIAAVWKYWLIEKATLRRKTFKNLIVIGITGSYGKTLTKEFLATILEEKFKILKTKANQNSEVGVSQAILKELKPEHQIFIVEMGAYNVGGIKLLCQIAKPKIGILTGINEQHMATFGLQENIIRAKYELIESLPDDGIAVFNGSDPHTTGLYMKTDKQKRIYSVGKTADHIRPDIVAKNVEVKKDSLTFEVSDKKGEKENFKVNLLGAQNISNLLGAILVAKELGMTFDEIKKAVKKVKVGKGGMRFLKGKNGLNILDSSYSANPDGVISHLEYLKIWPGKKVIIMPCLIELGSTSEKIHYEIGEAIGQICDLAIITTKDQFEKIKEGAIKSKMPEENILFLENPKQIFEKINKFCKRGDVVLLEGRVQKELVNLLKK
jgi:UDP-N-acetylmuramoyl-tripeptide--D-alanyl-D-alanine ligase